ncbi:glutamate-5-semialdehyde dehydrogenase [Bowmanella sp. Y26]|uniref:glutamate-5-semialdehyde dehydrogenase n=1 Tax=Bowmanella yangjiangensis TaxID=2811230 RepID=UPI001BDBD8F1|nr:glutamate-5-semialdehyde dehydrogenase [Bowmanella yangjiangensis]MBT1063927.1 glutamate-5-semialdehyde dehydrogenase [Bowmanella yangjiangensis]
MSFSIRDMAQKARMASRQLAKLSAQQKNAVLHSIADNLVSMSEQILTANQQDLASGKEAGLTDAMLDRLALNEKSLANIAEAVRQIAAQDDPIGSIRDIRRMPSGIDVGKMRIPLGVIAMIYESRPNVTIDAAALCFKAGNAVVLRGGKEALHSNLALAECIHQALSTHGVDANAVVVIPDPDRAIMNELLTLNQFIDLVIPRGGEGLIRFVSENSRIPVIQHFKGVCHLYVDKDADEVKALGLLTNGKTQRTGVCNALETLLVHKDIAPSFLPMAAAMFNERKVRVHACEKSMGYFHEAEPATDDDWDTEYLALEIAVRVVEDYAQAIEHLEAHSSGHTEVIATQDYSTAQRFIRDVNSAVVMANASSRFSDGGELGLGAEIGISTSKLHAYGPMGVESLTTEKFVVLGDGHIRQ